MLSMLIGGQLEVHLYPFLPCYLYLAGFVEKEIKKANIPIVDTGENPEVPFPRDMIDLEVIALTL